MTDEQIEKELRNRAYLHKREDDGKSFWFEIKDSFSRYTLDYITRLKAEIEAERKEHQAFCETAKEAVANAKKETAKEILQELERVLLNEVGKVNLDTKESPEFISIQCMLDWVYTLKQKYNVEVSANQ